MAGEVELVLPAREADLMGTPIRRALPRRQRRAVGPFVFLDHMGPRELAAGEGLDVPPHPHIGLATLTYLFEGALLHRDSLGSVQEIHPGEVNWMSAGRGIAHSECTPDALRANGGRVHGLQLWAALPREHEEDEPSFQHLGRETLPELALPCPDGNSARLVLVAGSAYGERAPLDVPSPLALVHVEAPTGTALSLPDEHPERAVYVVSGRLRADGTEHGPGTLLTFRPGEAGVEALERSTFAILTGDPLDGERHMSWNFVSSDPDRIRRAERAWKAGEFAPVPGEDERVPLPES